MQIACNASKLTLPNLPAVITRERLVRRIRACRSCGLILILGQAAQGKTTLAVDFLRHVNVPTAWISLDSKDADADCFYNLLIQALSLALPSLGLQARYLNTSHAPGDDDTATQLANQLHILWRELPEQIQIVLDGLERLPEQAPAFTIIRRLCDVSIHKGRTWILSRRQPPFEYQQAVVNQQMLVINSEDLALTPHEIQIYFEALHQFNLPHECIATLHRLTEGWPGALILLAQTLERMPPEQWVEYLSHDLTSRLCDETRHYFQEEVFNACPASSHPLLLRAAMPESFNADMLAEVLDIADVGQQLRELVRNNSFIRVLHHSRHHQVHYRFHPLFREFLRATFRDGYSPAEQKLFYTRIAAYYDARGETATAIKWHFLADDYDRAAGGLKRISTDLVIRGQFAELAEQINPFPEDQCQSDPWLFFLRTLTGRVNAGLRCLNDFESALARFSSRNDVRGQMLALAHLIEAGILLGQTPAVYLRWVEKAESWLVHQSTTHYYAWAKTLLWLYVGYGYIVSGLDLAKGLSAAHNALVLARKTGNEVLAARAAIISGLALATAGEFEKAGEMLSKTGPDPAAVALDEYGVLMTMAQVELSLRRGDLTTARNLTRSVGRDIETYGLLFLYPAYLDACGFLEIYEGRYAEARATCRYLLDVALLAGNPIYKGLAHRLSSLIHYHQANYSQAAVEARQALVEMVSGGPDTLHVMRTRQLLALASLHLQQYDTPAAVLPEASRFFEQTANPLSLAENFLLSGIWAHETGQWALSERNLKNGLHIVNVHRFERLILLGPDDAADIGRIASQYRIRMPEHWDGLPMARREHAQVSVATSETPLKSGCQSGRPALVVKTFGGFSVLRDGTVIEEDAWGGQRPKLLLKAILVRGLREIPKDLLMDDLWPESSPETALQNFKVTLHRLRKILEPGLQKGKGSAYIHLKGNLVSLDRKYCCVDLEQFLETCKEVKRCVINGEMDRIGMLGRTLTALYQGDFLPEEPYAPWVEMKRWALKDEYIEVLLKMAGFHQLQNQMDEAVDYCRTILRIDSCNEAAAQNLIRLYTAQGRINEAWQVYEHLDQVLRTELGVSPEPATIALMKKIETTAA